MGGQSIVGPLLRDYGTIVAYIRNQLTRNHVGGGVCLERSHPPRLHHRLHHTSQDGVRWEWQVSGASREVVRYLVTDCYIPRTIDTTKHMHACRGIHVIIIYRPMLRLDMQ